jgi:hypothetical protein
MLLFNGDAPRSAGHDAAADRLPQHHRPLVRSAFAGRLWTMGAVAPRRPRRESVLGEPDPCSSLSSVQVMVTDREPEACSNELVTSSMATSSASIRRSSGASARSRRSDWWSVVRQDGSSQARRTWREGRSLSVLFVGPPLSFSFSRFL